MSESLVTINQLYKSFFGAAALDGMDFSIGRGEIRCLIGENGCGKSTLIKIISGFYNYDKGDIYLNGKQFKRINPIEAMGEGIQVIYQDFSLFDNMTVAENIMMYQLVQGKGKVINRKEMRKKAEEAVERIKFNLDLDRYVYELNVAQKQMVAICRAMAQSARLLIMDEPTTALTTVEVEHLFQVVKGLKEKGVSILFVSHKLDEVFQISDSLTVMRGGRKVYESSSLTISKDELIYQITGKRCYGESKGFGIAEDGARVLYEVKEYTLEPYFKDISFSLREGEILGITGLLGSGRSELADSLFGVIQASRGEIVIKGKSFGVIQSVGQALALKIGYVPEDRLTEGIHLEQRISHNALAGIIEEMTGRVGLLSGRKMKDRQQAELSRIDIKGIRWNSPARSLSGGNQQKLVLVKWLATNPELIILNCPTVGVDIGAKSEIHGILKELAQSGVGVVVISDDIPEIMQLCSRVLIIENGRFVQERVIKDTAMEELEELLGGTGQKGEMAV